MELSNFELKTCSWPINSISVRKASNPSQGRASSNGLPNDPLHLCCPSLSTWSTTRHLRSTEQDFFQIPVARTSTIQRRCGSHHVLYICRYTTYTLESTATKAECPLESGCGVL